MNRATALLTSLACVMTLACNSSAEAPQQARAEAKPSATQAAQPSPSATPQAPSSAPELPAPVIDEPVLASTSIELPPAPKSEPKSEVKPEPKPEPKSEPPASKAGKPPIGAVGGSGIHLDDIAVGKGWASSRCEDLGTRFDVGTHERVNVCFRVVHPRVAETVTVEWAREGKLRQSIEVSVKPTQAYRTRAWLPVTEGRVGAWTATVKSQDGMVLGQVAFEIGE